MSDDKQFRSNNNEKKEKNEKKQNNVFSKWRNNYNRRKADKAYEKELNKSGRTTKTRNSEYGPYRKVERKLNVAILIVSILLIIVLLFVFFV